MAVDGVSTVANLLAREAEFEAAGDIRTALSYCARALDVDAGSAEARAAAERIEARAASVPTVTVRLGKTRRNDMGVRVDGKWVGGLLPGKDLSFSFPPGSAHTVGVTPMFVAEDGSNQVELYACDRFDKFVVDAYDVHFFTGRLKLSVSKVFG